MWMRASFSGAFFYSIHPHLKAISDSYSSHFIASCISRCHYIAIFSFLFLLSFLITSLSLISSLSYSIKPEDYHNRSPPIHSLLVFYLHWSYPIALLYSTTFYPIYPTCPLFPAQASWAPKATSFHHTPPTPTDPTHPSYTPTWKSHQKHTKSALLNGSATSHGLGTLSQ